MIAVVLFVLAAVAFLVAMVIGFGWVTSEYWPGWLALGLILFALAHLPWGAFPRRRSE